MKRNAALLLLALLPAMAPAKCVELTYLFEGQVLDESGKPAAGALVGASWLQFGQAAGPAIAIADGKGRYRLSVKFRPNDMQMFGAACKDRLDRINVVAYADGRRSYPTPIMITELKQELPSMSISEASR